VSTSTGPTSQTELDLIARAQDGDRHAYGELVRRHREGVVNVVYRMCGDTHLAEDSAQEAFVRAWQHLPDYRPRSPFRNWVYRIATNVALDAARRKPDTVNLDAVPLVDPAVGPEAAVMRKERAELVRQAVIALPPASRLVLVLREYEGLSYREIAEVADIPIGTVMSRLNYARKTLCRSLALELEVA
jgi:RNA polymerase sigma-70 factor (ECF subfamily)